MEILEGGPLSLITKFFLGDPLGRGVLTRVEFCLARLDGVFVSALLSAALRFVESDAYCLGLEVFLAVEALVDIFSVMFGGRSD